MSQYTKKLKRKIEKLKKEVGQTPFRTSLEHNLAAENTHLKEQLRHSNYDRGERGAIKSVERLISDNSVIVRYTDGWQEVISCELIERKQHPRWQDIKAQLVEQERGILTRNSDYVRRQIGTVSAHSHRPAADVSAESNINAENIRGMWNIMHTRPNIPQTYWNGDLYEDYNTPLTRDYQRGQDERKQRDDKAMQLLKEKIGNVLYKSLNDNEHFDVLGKEGLYRFYKSDKVELIQERKFIGSKKRKIMWNLCIESKVKNMPVGDVILARYLLLKADEAKFVETANFRSVKTVDEYEENGMRRFAVGDVVRVNDTGYLVQSVTQSDGAIDWNFLLP